MAAEIEIDKGMNTRMMSEYMKNKTLYVSDLDGTLLRSNQTTSEYTNEVINSLTEKGIVFLMRQQGLFTHHPK